MADRTTHSHDTSTPAMSDETVPSEEFVLVPREPTPAMERAFTRAYRAKDADIASPYPTEHPDDGGGAFGYGFRAMIAAAPTLSASHLAKEGGEAGARGGIYTASKTKHAPIWKDYRARGWPINSTWIDEAGPGESADLSDLWDRCIREASTAAVLVVYREGEDVLKGGWAELGAALACGVPVYAVGIQGFTIAKDRRIKHFETLEDAMDAAARLASLPQPSPVLAKGGDVVREAVKEALASELSEAYDCTRVWGAWNVGTMGQDDFVPINDRLDEIVETVLAALSTPTEGPTFQTEGMGGDALAPNVSNFDLAQMALCQVSWIEEGKVEHPHRLDTIREALARLAAIGPAIALEAKAAAYMNAEHLRQYAAKECDGIFWASPDRSEFYDTPLFATLTPPETAEAVPAASDPAPATDDRERLVEADEVARQRKRADHNAELWWKVKERLEAERAAHEKTRADLRSYEITFGMMHDTAAERDVSAERARQKAVEGYDEKRDDKLGAWELGNAAASYAMWRPFDESGYIHNELWPWHGEHWKPKDRRSDLVRAGALILAEIERLDRAALATEASR